MTINEILQARGLGEPDITGILDDLRANKLFFSSEENMDIRYGKLKTQHEGTSKQLEEALATIEQLKKSTKGQEDAQKQIAEHEARERALLAELEKTRLESAIKVELLASHAKDVDYLAFKLSEKLKRDGETLSLDENGAIKGWEEKLNGLKTQFPAMFEAESSAGDDGYQVFEPNKLRRGEGGETAPTKESFRTMGYEERLALKQKNEKLYKQLAK